MRKVEAMGWNSKRFHGGNVDVIRREVCKTCGGDRFGHDLKYRDHTFELLTLYQLNDRFSPLYMSLTRASAEELIVVLMAALTDWHGTLPE